MRFAIAFLVAFLVGAGCRYFDIPVPSPPAIPGVILIGAITLGYLSVDRMIQSKPPTPPPHDSSITSGRK